jgi:peroxiredoxin
MTVSKRNRMRTLTISITAVVAVGCVGLVALLASRGPAAAIPFNSPLLNHQAPKATLMSLEGKPISLRPTDGKPLVINFFASWCPPCKAETPQLNAFAYDQSTKAHGAEMLGVVFNDADSAAKQFGINEGILYPLLSDTGGVVASEYGVTSPPTTFLIDASGVVVRAWVGQVTAQILDEAVASVGGR